MNKISYLIPVYNEKETVEKAIKLILNIKFKNKEIIVIDNGSFDGSQEIIGKFKNKKKIKIILRKKNLGYGQSVIEAAKIARGKYIYIHFSDNEYDHRASIKMFTLAEKYNADAVFGSRLKNKSFSQKIKAVIKKPAFVATFIITFLYNFFYKKNFTDVIGSKFYKTSIFKRISLKEKTLTWSSWDFEFKNRLISGPYKILETYTKYKARKDRSKSNLRVYHLIFMIYLIIKFKIKKIFS